MFFDLFRSPLSTGAQQSRVPVNLSSNSQDQNDLIVNELYDEIIKPINSAEIDSESTDRSQKIISKVKELDIGDKQKILEKLRIKLNEYFNQKDGEIERIPDELMRGLLRIGFNARMKIFKNFKESIAPQNNSSILPEVKQVVVVDKRSESTKLDLEYFEMALQDCTNSRLRTKDNLPKNEFKDYETKENKIKDELLEMQKSQNPKDKNFFKNYLDKYLELIKLYEDSKKVMIEKFKERGVDKNLVNQEIDPLIREAYQDCLNFLIANSQTRPKNQANETLESDLVVEQQSIRPSDPVAKTLESESNRGNRLRIHSGHPTQKSNAR